MELLYKPWPWYVAGAAIGLTVPTLLLLGNKRLGISSTLRHLCAACVPASIPFFHYDWKSQSWSLFFAGGILLGGFLGGYVFSDPNAPIQVGEEMKGLFRSWGLDDQTGLMPRELFNSSSIFTLQGFLFMIIGGFLVGFGTRYAGGCTSGHGILGLSALQWLSLVATACFFIGGILFSHFVLPYLVEL
jgi:uncharacterized protein